MTTELSADWSRTNQLLLMDEVAGVRAALERHAVGESPILAEPTSHHAGSALDRVCEIFGLTAFERAILVMCAAIELDGSFALVCARAAGDPTHPYPTFGLALAAFGEAHWSALTPLAPLRRWMLVQLTAEAPITTSPLRIDENILHELAGVSEIDARLRPFLSHSLGDGDELVRSQRAAVERVVRFLQADHRTNVLVQIAGRDRAAARCVAGEAFETLGVSAVVLDARSVPRDPIDAERLTRIWEREMLLHGSGLYVDAHGLDEAVETSSVVAFAETAPGQIVVGADRPLGFARRTTYNVEVTKPTRFEQRDLWRTLLANGGSDAGDALAGQFDFTTASIRAAAASARTENGLAAAGVWPVACAVARTALDRVAQRLDGRSAADALVLPPLQRDALCRIVAHARNRTRVYEDWGMGGTGTRGLGLSALFDGPSGTGKTLAAEAIGSELGVDVYRVDLSALVSKYVGETEKNLRAVFDAAEDGGAILLFDECDALFGKRGEVQYGHDRYANLEVSYLLQRVETYRGVAILTTNMRGAIDPAFLRRIRFIVTFPFPDYEQRVAIWRRSFASGVPTEGLDFTKAARLNVTGGNIRNIVMSAAFMAADEQVPVRMTHLLSAARAECLKIERTPSELEIGSWT